LVKACCSVLAHLVNDQVTLVKVLPALAEGLGVTIAEALGERRDDIAFRPRGPCNQSATVLGGKFRRLASVGAERFRFASASRNQTSNG